MPTERHILIGGEAGQGLDTMGFVLCKALVRTGYEILVTQSYHSRIRGGHNTFSIRVGTEKLSGPGEAVDVLVALNAETVDLHRGELAPEGLLLADKALDLPSDGHVAVPFEELASKKLLNTAALGLLGVLFDLDPALLLKGIENLIGKRHPELLDDNKAALEKAGAWGRGQALPSFALGPPPNREKRLMLNGNEAIALGAMAAGVKFCAFYPMTPATSIALNLIAHADRMGMVVEQAEDEIAALNMALGASFAGAASLTCTSGGGFALMTEAVSLAGMTETPVVIALAQRPGPATGLPTRTEQGDLDFVLHAGHGEFPRAIFAPGSVEACFELARRAMRQAERYQTPVFVLTDQYLADSYRAVAPFALEGLEPVHPGGAYSGQGPYHRYAVAEGGISPRLIPGDSAHLVVADSDEHTEDGHITEDLSIRTQMVEKRLKKFEGLLAETLPPTREGEASPDLLLVTWGSTQGPAREAAQRLKNEGTSVGTLHFDQVWPLRADQFLENLRSAKVAVAIEGNAAGQFARLIRRETGFEFPHRIPRYDGLPFTAGYIVDHLKKLGLA